MLNNQMVILICFDAEHADKPPDVIFGETWTDLVVPIFTPTRWRFLMVFARPFWFLAAGYLWPDKRNGWRLSCQKASGDNDVQLEGWSVGSFLNWTLHCQRVILESSYDFQYSAIAQAFADAAGFPRRICEAPLRTHGAARCVTLAQGQRMESEFWQADFLKPRCWNELCRNMMHTAENRNLKANKGESEHWVVRRHLLYIYEHLIQIRDIQIFRSSCCGNLHTLDIT